MKLNYNRSATRWVEALPLGNGRLGAMIWEIGKLKQVEIKSHLGQQCRVRCGDNTVEFATQAGDSYRLDSQLAQKGMIALKAV